MYIIIFQTYRAIRFVTRMLTRFIAMQRTKFLFYLYKVSYKKGFRTNGIPVIDITPGCKMGVGHNFRINNKLSGNPIGRQQPCFFILNHNSKLTIGDNVGLSSTAIICHCKITIGNNVRSGGNTVIYDTDFHSLNKHNRQKNHEDQNMVEKRPVYIHDNVFIGAHSTILKGVTVGENSIIGACSVVTKNIPSNEIWGGNPAKFIRSIYPSR